MIMALAQDNKFWAYQAKEFLLSLKSATSVEKVAPYLIASVTDRLLAHTLFDVVKNDSIESKLTI